MQRSIGFYITVGVFCCCLLSAVRSTGMSFNGFKHYRLTAQSPEAAAKIRWLQRTFPSEPNPNTGLTFLSGPSHQFESVSVLVPPDMEAALLEAVRSTSALKAHLVNRNFGRQLAQFNRQNELSRAAADDAPSRVRRDANSQTGLSFRHDFYRSFRAIRIALLQLNNKCNRIAPGTCSLKTIGFTYQNRELMVLQISKAGSKNKVWIDGGIHAREWISPATVLYIADQLIASLTSNSSLTNGLLDTFEVMIMPVFNPDGYEFSRLQNRFWRKNREPTRVRRCHGVDLNRNYGFRWGGGRNSRSSSGNPCDNTYRGHAEFSSLETAAVKRFIESEKSRLLLFASFHSFGQYILLPYGYKKATYSNTHHAKMCCAAHNAAYNIFALNSRFYTYGTGSDMMYAANGGSDDWAHGSVGIPYSFTFELPDEGDFGFLLPPAEVPGVGREALTGLRALLETADKLEAGDPAVVAKCNAIIGK